MAEKISEKIHISYEKLKCLNAQRVKLVTEGNIYLQLSTASLCI